MIHRLLIIKTDRITGIYLPVLSGQDRMLMRQYMRKEGKIFAGISGEFFYRP